MKWLVTILYWLQAFASPVIISALIGLAIGRETVLWILLGAGVISGIILAEYIRKKTGLSVFFARLYNNEAPAEANLKNEQDATTDK